MAVLPLHTLYQMHCQLTQPYCCSCCHDCPYRAHGRRILVGLWAPLRCQPQRHLGHGETWQHGRGPQTPNQKTCCEPTKSTPKNQRSCCPKQQRKDRSKKKRQTAADRLIYQGRKRLSGCCWYEEDNGNKSAIYSSYILAPRNNMAPTAHSPRDIVPYSALLTIAEHTLRRQSAPLCWPCKADRRTNCLCNAAEYPRRHLDDLSAVGRAGASPLTH
jgi:hypothetical protein